LAGARDTCGEVSGSEKHFAERKINPRLSIAFCARCDWRYLPRRPRASN
jgi:hypothetical protein